MTIEAMGTSAMGLLPTSRASCYLQQLCRHMSDRYAVDFHPTAGRIALPLGAVELNAGDMALLVTCTPHEADDLGRMQRVVGDHLSRFAMDDGAPALHWGRC